MAFTLNRHAVEPRMWAAVNEVWKSSGGNTTIDPLAKSKSLIKFGRHPTLGTTRQMIWSHGPDDGEETLLTTNAITHIISSDANDDQDVRIEYHTISGSDLTFGVQTATLNGQTAVALTTPCARMSRINNTSATELAGDIYAYEGGATTNGVPNDLTTVHARIDAGNQQTEKAATSISATDYWLITFMTGHLLGSNTARVRLELEKRNMSGVWLPTGVTVGLGNAGNTQATVQLDPVIIIPANTDVRVMGTSSATNTDVAAYFGGHLASII